MPRRLQPYQASLDSRPVLVSEGWWRNLARLHRLLLETLQQLLVREETADFLEIDGLARDQLRWARQFPLRLGCLRPDFIIDARGRPLICEINGRFAVNGFLCSAYLSDQFAAALPGYAPGCSGERIRAALALPPGSLIVKQSEPGWDIHQLSEMHAAPIVGEPAEASCLVLELHQEELLRLPRSHWPRPPYFNDLRTQWLGHDKRLLQLLAESNDELAGFIVPTEGLPGRWGREAVLKPNRSGKGQGLVFGFDHTAEEWQRYLNQAPSQWVVQKHIESLRLDDERLVGTLLSRDLQPLGLGIFRASRQRIVNVSGGGRVLFPMVARDE